MSPTGADAPPARPPLRRVWLDTLALTDFRNYRSVRLALGPPSVVLVGRNGAGKTNLLEAVSVLSPGRGLRRARYEEMARAAADDAAGGGWTVSARVSRETAFG
jgi:DNA replication and repair protein RecF